MNPVTTKADMYRRLIAGEFGNTIPRWFDYDRWCDEGRSRYRLWGVQHTAKPAFPGTRLDVLGDEVSALLIDNGFGSDYCISPMVHQVGRVQWEGDVYDHPERGLICSGNFAPRPGSWRTHMKAPRLWEFTAARMLLRHVMNPNSHADLMELIGRFPGHVVELSALDVCFGSVSHRNAVVWEVRRY